MRRHRDRHDHAAGGDAGTVALTATTATTATIGVICLAAGLHGYFFRGPTRWWKRAMLVAAALVLIKPGWVTDAIGVGLIALTYASQRWFAPAARPAVQAN